MSDPIELLLADLREYARVAETWDASDDAGMCRAAADEIERLRAGGCARDQGLTQFCAEAAELARELERVKVALANALSERDHARAMLECARNG